MGKHILGVVLVAFAIFIPTGPLVYWLFGEWAMGLYVKLILPMLALPGYVIWLALLDDIDKAKKP